MNISGKAYVYGKTERLNSIVDAINNSFNSRSLEKLLKVDFEECYDEDDKWEVESFDTFDEQHSWLIINYYGDNFWTQLTAIIGESDLDDDDSDIEIVDYANYDSCETNDAYALNVRDRYYYKEDGNRSKYFETLTELIAEVKEKFAVPANLTEKWDIVRWCALEKDIDLTIGELEVQYHICAPWSRNDYNIIRLNK